MRRFGWTVGLMVLVGCEPTPPTYNGFVMEDFFPFDGDRTWEFVNDDPTLSYHVIATLDPVFEAAENGAQHIYTINYTIECFAEDPSCVTGDPFRVRAIRMSSDQSFGTLIHSVDFTDTGIETFDPKIELTGKNGKPGDVWTTDTAGFTFASRFDHKADCDVPYTDQWTDCVTILVDGDGTDNVANVEGGHPLFGEWTAVTGYNVIQFQWRDDPQPWRLLSQSWETIED
jgi:hypothetical protein